MKIFILLVLFVAYVHSQSVVGGVSDVDKKELKDRLIKLVKDNLSTFEGSWELQKVNKVTYQVVAGALFRVHGLFKETGENKFYEGTVAIWEQPWVNFREVTFEKGQEVSNNV